MDGEEISANYNNFMNKYNLCESNVIMRIQKSRNTHNQQTLWLTCQRERYGSQRVQSTLNLVKSTAPFFRILILNA